MGVTDCVHQSLLEASLNTFTECGRSRIWTKFLTKLEEKKEMYQTEREYRVVEMKEQFSSVPSLSRVRLFVTTWTAVCQASLFITNCRSLLKLMSIESVMPSNPLILK